MYSIIKNQNNDSMNLIFTKMLMFEILLKIIFYGFLNFSEDTKNIVCQ